ncbi:hypothetical protein F66182_1988 [Fusarium sp. NRRL 66182]|nr:hypothetical protein F66182_1988 [Fusarium sp. NRRL 66182]
MQLHVPARRLFEYIQRHVYTKCKDPRGDLITLPPEIILIIAQYLPGASLVSLSLTCRPYRTLLARAARHIKLEGTEMENFLCQLEKDSTNWYFCYSCVKLHYWNSLWSNQGRYDCWFKMPKCVDDYTGWQPSEHDLHIRYTHARLIMNRHFYGSDHGLPLTTLNYNDRVRRCENGVKHQWSSQARIIQDELFVCKTLRFWHRRDQQMRELLSLFGLRICPHINGFKSDVSWCYTIPELAKALEVLEPCENSFGSCPACLTDYSLSIRWQTGWKQGWLIELTVFQQVGVSEKGQVLCCSAGSAQMAKNVLQREYT